MRLLSTNALDVYMTLFIVPRHRATRCYTTVSDPYKLPWLVLVIIKGLFAPWFHDAVLLKADTQRSLLKVITLQKAITSFSRDRFNK